MSITEDPSLTSDFHASYTAANVPQGAASYDSERIAQIHHELLAADSAYLSDLSYALVAVMFCAQRRGDAVASWFQDLVEDKSPEQIQIIFATVREAITVAYPFLGLPNCIPACFGIISVMKDLGIQSVHERRRADVNHPAIHEQGLATRKKIYRGVGNPEVHMMMKEYFPDMTYATDCFIFGYLATGSLDVFSLQKTELIIATGITAMGATRQTRSHIKAAMQQGNSPVVVSAMVRAASKIMEWNGQLLGNFDIGALEKELHANLAKEDSGSGLPA